MSRANPAWHRGYDEGQAAADQELAVCAPPDEYDSLDATEFMAGWHTGRSHRKPESDKQTKTFRHPVTDQAVEVDIRTGRIVSAKAD